MINRAVITLLISLIGTSAFAQTKLQSTSAATTNSVAGATNAGNAQNINFVTNSDGTTTLKTAPSMGGNSFYGSFSTDNCMVSGGGTISTILGGASVVSPIRDPECSKLRVFERTMQLASTVRVYDAPKSDKITQAATDILCQVSEEAKKALAYQGLCSDLDAPVVSKEIKSNVNDQTMVKLTYSSQLNTFIEN